MKDRHDCVSEPVTDGPASVVAAQRTTLEVVTGGCALLALVAVSIRRFVPIASADPLLYGLMSTDHLTFFYWGQDRLANVVPLLAWPIRDVSANFFAQMSIHAASYFVLIGTFAWFHVRRCNWRTENNAIPTAVTGAALAGAISIVLLTRFGGYTFVVEQPYSLSTLLFLAGINAVTSESWWRWLVGACGVLVATLMIPSVVLLAPAAALMRDDLRWVSRTARAFAVAGGAFVVSAVTSRIAVDGATTSNSYADFSWATLREGFRPVIENIGASTNTKSTLAIGLLCAATLTLRRGQLSPMLRIAHLSTPFVALAWITLFSSNRWVSDNLFGFRYFFTAYACGLFLLTGAIVEMISTAGPAVRRSVAARSAISRATSAAAVVAVVSAVAVVAVVRATTTSVLALDAARAEFGATALFDPDLVVGDYWRVWPIVFLVRDEGGDIQGVTYRSDAVRGDIMDVVNSAPPNGTLNILCVGVAGDQCVAQLSTFTERSVRAVGTSRGSPVIVEVVVGS